MPRIKSEGQCNLCGKIFAKQAMTRHLLACIRQPRPLPPSSRKRLRTAVVFHLLIQGYYAPEYWLHLEIAADAKLIDLDQFLRDIWLECCGHLSAFTITNVKHNATGEVWDLNNRQSLWDTPLNFDFIDIDDDSHCFNKRLSELLKPGVEFDYEYDFGSTTNLKLKVVAERESQVSGNRINILARNNPPVFLCESCREENATQICLECEWKGEGWLCAKCAKQHLKHKEMFLPVVNSPRAGVCGYTG
jgi:hypothetical protein